MGEELRERWRAYLEQEGDPEQRARQHIADWTFTPGKRGEQEREYALGWFTELFQDKDLQRLEDSQFPRNETPATAMQTVAAFMTPGPLLNGHAGTRASAVCLASTSGSTPPRPVYQCPECALTATLAPTRISQRITLPAVRRAQRRSTPDFCGSGSEPTLPASTASACRGMATA